MANPNPKNQFSKENQPRSRSEGYRKKIIDALKLCGKDEMSYLQHYIEKAMREDGMAGEREILMRISPAPKATLPTIHVEYPSKASPVQKIDFVIESVASGDIPADIGQSLVQMIRASMDAQELTDVIERLEKLERMLSGGVNGQEAGE